MNGFISYLASVSWGLPFIEKLRTVFIIFLVASIVSFFFRQAIKRSTQLIRHPRFSLVASKEKRVRTVRSVLDSLGLLLIFGIAIFFTLETLGVNLAPFLASAGILGLAVGFGAQSLVKDFITGVFFLVEGQFDEGDVVEINSVEGSVEKIGFRTVSVRDLAGALHIFQNSQITKVKNLTKDWARVDIALLVAQEPKIDDVTKSIGLAVQKVLSTEEMKKIVLGEPEVLSVEGIETGGKIKLKVLVKVKPKKQWTVKRALLLEIKRQFEKDSIEFA
ncbi:MAG TPA: mechanosensitive ion channel domain-containing protein [Patescibacteria group bacterium]|nr:mechanosensitive ion channel domain-containing protein [Patescibacteria group bacterium]